MRMLLWNSGRSHVIAEADILSKTRRSQRGCLINTSELGAINVIPEQSRRQCVSEHQSACLPPLTTVSVNSNLPGPPSTLLYTAQSLRRKPRDTKT